MHFSGSLLRIAMLISLTATVFAAGPQQTFDDGWKFTQHDPAGAESPLFDDAKWRSVDLPHDWAIAGPISLSNSPGSPGGFFPAGVGWYRKTFVAPGEWSGKHVTITFDGAYMQSAVWLNGHELAVHNNGFTPFTVNLTPHLTFGGTNTIAVAVLHNLCQQNCRWYSGSALYRHARLDVRDPSSHRRIRCLCDI